MTINNIIKNLKNGLKAGTIDENQATFEILKSDNYSYFINQHICDILNKYIHDPSNRKLIIKHLVNHESTALYFNFLEKSKNTKENDYTINLLTRKPHTTQIIHQLSCYNLTKKQKSIIYENFISMPRTKFEIHNFQSIFPDFQWEYKSYQGF